MNPHPPAPGLSAPLSHPSPSRGRSPCALPRVFHPQPARLLQHLSPDRAQPLAKPHSHLGRQSAPPPAPRGAAGRVHSSRGQGGGWLKLDARKQALVMWPPDRAELSEGKRQNPRLTGVRREKL